MKSLLLGVSLALALAACTPAAPAKTEPAAETPAAPAAKIPYGSNQSASGTFIHDGVTLYYETYGQGEPLLLVHGNGGSIGTMAAQIEHFKATYKVIAMDSRDHGRSSDSTTAINYEKMTDDLAALIDHLKTGPVDVIGWSDGGIEALLLGMRHPDKVKKLVVMAANLNPSTDAVYPEVLALFDPNQIPEDVKATPAGKRQAKVAGMTQTEPNIDPKELAKVVAPTLIVAGDHDLIRTEHTVEIFNALPNANLAILPNNTHAAPFDDPVLFNATAERFLKMPFKKKDRIADLLAAFAKASEPAK